MSKLLLEVEVFTKEETFDSAKSKFANLLSAINNDLVEVEDREHKSFLNFSFDKWPRTYAGWVVILAGAYS